MEEKPIIVGRVLKAHGNRGEIKVELLTDFPERFSPGSIVLINDFDEKVISGVRGAGGTKIVKFEGIDTREKAKDLQGLYLKVRFSERKSLQEGQYYEFELVGCDVFVDGRKVGTVRDLRKSAGQDLLIVETESEKGAMIPLVKAIVKEIDIAAKKIEVRNIAGLIEESK